MAKIRLHKTAFVKVICIASTFLFSFVFSEQSNALIDGNKFLSIRLMQASGSFSGARDGSFSSMPAFEGEFLYFTDAKTAYTLYGAMAQDSATGAISYLSGGLGQKYFFSSSSLYGKFNYDAYDIQLKPKYKLYMGWSLGVSNVLLKAVTSVLSIQSTGWELGGSGGMYYYIWDDYALELGMFMGYLYGFSNVAVTGIVQKIYLGFVF